MNRECCKTLCSQFYFGSDAAQPPEIDTQIVEQTMILNIPASIEKEGSSVIPVDTLLNIANELPDGRITLSVDKKLNISIKSETGDYDLKGMSPEEFPAPPELDKQSPVIFSSELLF